MDFSRFLGKFMVISVMFFESANIWIKTNYPLPQSDFYPDQPRILQNHNVYLPIVIKSIPEMDLPSCRWYKPNSSGLGIPYYWGNTLQTPGTPWRIAFETAISDWNFAPTNIYFYYYEDGFVSFNTYSLIEDHLYGFALLNCFDGYTRAVDVFGNLAYDIGNENFRHGTAGHETGHAQSIGHISEIEIALMNKVNIDPYNLFVPQQSDIGLVNQIYK